MQLCAASGLQMERHLPLVPVNASVCVAFRALIIVRICTFNTYENLWVNPSGLHAKLEKETEESGTETPTISNKAKGSIFCICWDRTGQLLCRGSLDGTMSIVSTYYDPTQPFE